MSDGTYREPVKVAAAFCSLGRLLNARASRSCEALRSAVDDAGHALRGNRRMTSAVSRWFCLALALGACAALANTPKQNLAYDRWAQCSRPSVTLKSVSVEGQIGFLYTDPADRRDVVQCLSDAGHAGPPLPPPVGFQPVGGP
jgi:hypothetical protein